MLIRKSFPLIIYMLLMVTAVPVFIILACSSPLEQSAEGPVEQTAGEMEEIIPRIGPILFEPEGESGPNGLVFIKEQVTISVEAHGAQRVEFYVTPATEEGLGVLFWDDNNPHDGWGAFWEPPLTENFFRLTAIAYFNGKTVQSSRTVIAQTKDSETPLAVERAGEPYTLINQQSRISIIEGLPQYFQSGGWIDEHTIFGLSGNNPVLFNLETGRSRFPHITVWEAHLSPEKRYFSYINEHGVHVAQVDGNENRHLWPREGLAGNGFPRGGLWAPFSDKLLVWWEHEWDCVFFIYELHSDRVQELKTHLDGYFLTTATGWADEQNIIFTTRASIMKDGFRDYSFGYRSDLAAYNLETGSFLLLTDAADREFFEGLSAEPEGIFYLRWFGNRNDVYYGVMNLEGSVIWEEPFYGPASFFLAPDGKEVACLVKTGRSEINSVYELMIISREGSRTIVELQIADHRIPEIFWHPTGKKLLISYSSAFRQGETPNAYLDFYYTMVVEP